MTPQTLRAEAPPVSLDEITTTDAAKEIVAQMSDDDRAIYTTAAWREGVGSWASWEDGGAWSHLDLDEALEAVRALIDISHRVQPRHGRYRRRGA